MATPFTYSERNKKIKILVVDDDNDVAITTKAILEETDDNEEKQDNNKKSKEFEVDLFNDPETALSDFKSGHYGLVVT